jgi:hypothetical protein
MVFFVFNPKTIYSQELYPALPSTLIDALVFFYSQKGLPPVALLPKEKYTRPLHKEFRFRQG